MTTGQCTTHAPPAYGTLSTDDVDTEFRSGWWIHTFERVDSTNTVAARLPVWDAVRAEEQTTGRGRTGRVWISDRGGLWLSAVLPCAASQPHWRYLPLAVGWGVARMLRDELGIEGLRVRWPNDLMVGDRKLAGLLVERFSREAIVVGIGINVYNTPELHDERLVGATARLADLAQGFVDLEELTVRVLVGIREGHTVLAREGFPKISRELNAEWTEPRRVELTLTSGKPRIVGRFAGIDERGSLRLTMDDGEECSFAPTDVALLRELI